MRATVAFVALALTAAASVLSAPTELLLTSYVASECNEHPLNFNVSVPLGTCLNNHDFNKVACGTLNGCIGNLTMQYGATIPYEGLVNCTGASAMPLSVMPTFDEATNQLQVKLYVISHACWGIPVTLHFSRGQCASQFAISSSCGIAGSSVAWN